MDTLLESEATFHDGASALHDMGYDQETDLGSKRQVPAIPTKAQLEQCPVEHSGDLLTQVPTL